MSTKTRVAIVCVLMLAAAGVLMRAERMAPVPIREPLAMLPFAMEPWQGSKAPDFEKQILDVLGVDDYISRYYTRAGSPGLGLYVGYYRTQSEGDTMHSPLNCLPGAGWLPTRQERKNITVTDADGQSREILVNDYVISKGLDRQVVIYWYQSHGRVVASEYWGKVYTVVDAIRYNRTDGALVRVTSPVTRNDDRALEEAEARAVRFVQAVFPRLGRHLPS